MQFDVGLEAGEKRKAGFHGNLDTAYSASQVARKGSRWKQFEIIWDKILTERVCVCVSHISCVPGCSLPGDRAVV